MPETPDVELIQSQFDEALAITAEVGTKYPAMSYEEGVRDALGWILGERDEPPMEVTD